MAEDEKNVKKTSQMSPRQDSYRLTALFFWIFVPRLRASKIIGAAKTHQQ